MHLVFWRLHSFAPVSCPRFFFCEWDLCSSKAWSSLQMTPKIPSGDFSFLFFFFLSEVHHFLGIGHASTSTPHKGDECCTFISIEKWYTLDKIKPGCGMTYLNSYEGFLCCWENTGPWATLGLFDVLKLYLFFYVQSNLSVSVNFLNAT